MKKVIASIILLSPAIIGAIWLFFSMVYSISLLAALSVWILAAVLLLIFYWAFKTIFC